MICQYCREKKIFLFHCSRNRSGTDQSLIEGKQRFVDFVYVVIATFDEILHDDVELTGVRQGEAGLREHLLKLIKWQLQCERKGQHGRLRRLIELIRTDLRKDFPAGSC